MKLSAWAKKQGICYQTAWRWVRDDKMPVPFKKMPSGTIIVYDVEQEKMDKEMKNGEEKNHNNGK